jgi:hypothetical protein
MTFFNFPTRLARAAFVAVCGAALVGCASVKMAPADASPDSVQALRSAHLVRAKTGSFVLAPGKDASMDTTLGGLRGSEMTPNDGTFSHDLRNVIEADLKAAGLYDAASDAVIEGRLTDSAVDAAMGTGSGRLAAQFSVTRGGKKVYDKELKVESKWDSSFIGAVAIPTAMQQYGALYQQLAAKLFADAEFRSALAG